MNVIRNEARNKASFELTLKVNYKDIQNKLVSIEKEFIVHSQDYRSNSDEYRTLWNNSKVIIVDKSNKTSALFDESNPFSLVSIVRQNYVKNAFPMSIFAAQRAMEKGKKLHVGTYGPDYVFPIIESDSLNPNYGKEKIDQNGNYLYPPRAEFFYDVTDIDRIILFLKDDVNKNNELSIQSITHVAYCKKYSNNEKYEVVMAFPFFENLLDAGMLAFQESNEGNTNRFINLKNQLADRNIVNYKAGGYEIIEANNRKIDYTAKEPGLSLNLFDFDKDKFPAEAIFNTRSFQYHVNPVVFKSFSRAFHSVEYDSIISDFPLVDMFGEDSVIYNNDGSLSYVYPIDYRIKKINLNTNFKAKDELPLKVIIKYELQLNSEKTPSFIPITAIYCVRNDSNSEWFVFASIDSNDLKDGDYSLIEKVEIDWISILEKELRKGKMINLKNKKEKSELKKDINLDF
jgi:hypothetical protein